VRIRYWIVISGAFASACTSGLRRPNAIATPPTADGKASVSPSVAKIPPRNDDATDRESALAFDSWRKFSGETRCSGISEVVSFDFSAQRHEIRDFVIEETCQYPPTGTARKVRWKSANHFSTDSAGLFAVSEVDSTVSAQTAITMRGAFRASGRMSHSSAGGTLSDHVTIECGRGQKPKNCRKWNAKAVTGGSSIGGPAGTPPP
jgi:hypothetical protein